MRFQSKARGDFRISRHQLLFVMILTPIQPMLGIQIQHCQVRILRREFSERARNLPRLIDYSPIPFTRVLLRESQRPLRLSLRAYRSVGWATITVDVFQFL